MLTLHAGGGRVELSGATTANWVAKSANLLVDGYGGPSRVGLLLPLHWQTVALLLAGVATGATVVVADEPADLAGSEVAFVGGEHAEAALPAGADEVLALSGHPLGSAPADRARPASPTTPSRCRPTPTPGADPCRAGSTSRPAARCCPPLPELALGRADRVLTTVRPADPDGLAALLAVLRCGRGAGARPRAGRGRPGARRGAGGRHRDAGRRRRRCPGAARHTAAETRPRRGWR